MTPLRSWLIDPYPPPRTNPGGIDRPLLFCYVFAIRPIQSALPTSGGKVRKRIRKMLVAWSILSMALLGLGALQTISLGTKTLVNNELVLGAPFEAEFEISVLPIQADTPTRVRVSGKMYRSSDGHKRIEQGEDRVLIYDPTARTYYVIFSSARTVRVLERGFGPVEPSSLFNKEPEPGNEIEGIPCVVGKFSSPGGAYEIWASPDLQEILLEKLTNGKEERVTRLYNIKRTEPDPDLFKIPSDYVLEPALPAVTGAIARKKIELKKALEIYNACQGLSGTQLTQAVDRALEFFNSAESHGGTIDLHIKDVYIVGRREGDNIYFDEDAFYGALRKMGCDK